jgi:hypothetical protein
MANVAPAPVTMEASDLYGRPLDRFTSERNALAKRLRQNGRGEEASQVAELRKPSVAAWAVNQLVRTQRQDIEQLFAAGDAALRAQEALINGRGEAEALRQAAAAERHAVERLTGTARGLLSSHGEELSPAKLEQVSETLHAAALDPGARELVKEGCLERELRHVGLGALGLTQAVPAGPARSGSPRSTPRTGRQQRRPKPAPSRPSPDELLRAARQAEGDARRIAERAQRELRRAQERREQAADALQAAEQELVSVQERIAQAQQEHQRAQRELEQLKRRARAPRRR